MNKGSGPNSSRHRRIRPLRPAPRPSVGPALLFAWFLHQSGMGMSQSSLSRSNGARSRAVVCLSGGM
ncbi:MAG TPA: hypothetical protein VGM02_10770, partial [Acidobacteriaceae bacterium]